MVLVKLYDEEEAKNMRNILRQIIVVFATALYCYWLIWKAHSGPEVMGSAADFRVNDAQPRTAYFANTAQREAAALVRGSRFRMHLPPGQRGQSLEPRYSPLNPACQRLAPCISVYA